MRLVRIQRPEPNRGRRLRQDTSPSSWETRVQIPSAAPTCARSKTGQCAGLRIRAVEVRVLPCAPIHQGVGEPGRPCLPWKQETGGSNPPALTNLMPVSSVGRVPLSESGCPRFKSATGCQSTRCPSGQGALCKSAHATLTPASRACAGLSHMDSAAQQAPQYLPLAGGGMESPPCDGAICDYPARTRGRVGCWSPSSSGSSGEAPIF